MFFFITFYHIIISFLTKYITLVGKYVSELFF